ncbi:phosphatase [Parastagonospora nodorum]|nr:phosphatase [Parastagonospora nodorum]
MTDSKSPRPVSVLFVCLGNICRSTMSEGVFTSLAPSHPLTKSIDSCGTGAYHVGSSPDRRTMSTLKSHGITTYRHKARKFDARKDFDEFEYILAMDAENLSDLEAERKSVVRKRGGEEGVGKVMLFGEFGGKKGEEVEDPYYGGEEGFEEAYRQAVRFSKGFLEKLEAGELS